ncbi:MAG: trypsin-like serine protease [Paracoccaceae bacterium]
MRILLAAAIAALTSVTGPAYAEDATELNSMMTAYEARGWEGVGRLNIGWSGMCTGAMIAPRIVLTAAHCLYNSRNGQRVDPTSIEFHAGFRNGRASASRKVRRAVIHPAYIYDSADGDLRVSNDLALLELSSEIRLSNIAPFPTGKRPRKGQKVGVVSYAHDRDQSPSIQEVCHVLARQRGTLVLSCDVDFGSSGAPIFAEVDGRAQIVSVVSAKAEVRGRKVSLGTNLEKPLAEMMALLRNGGGLTAAAKPEIRSVGANTKPRRLNGGDGAKFLRP